MKRIPFSYSFLLSLLVVICLLACSRVKEIEPVIDQALFPMDEGKFRLSMVMDTTFTTAGPRPESYIKKEEITSFTQDQEGNTLGLVQTYRSSPALLPDYQFLKDRVWQRTLVPFASNEFFLAQRIEENIRETVLKLPVFQGLEWDGNQYNNRGSRIYKYIQTDSTVIVRGQSYIHCVVVLEISEFTQISQKLAYSIYAPGIGRIKKYEKELLFDLPNGGFNPDKSRIYVEELIEHNFSD